MQQATNYPEFKVDVDRTRPTSWASPKATSPTAWPRPWPAACQTAPAFWLEPAQRRLLSDRHPDARSIAWITLDDAGQCAGHRRQARRQPGARRRWPTIHRATPDRGRSSHYAIQPAFDIYATHAGPRPGRRSPTTSRRSSKPTAKDRAEGRDRHPARPGRHHEHRLLGPALRPARARSC